MSSFTCPKCQGPREGKALYCAFCGIIFARYSAALGAAAQAPAVARQPPPAGDLSVALPGELGRAEEAVLASSRSNYELAPPVSRLAAHFLNGLVICFLMAPGFLIAFLLTLISDNKNVSTVLVVLCMGLPLTIWIVRNLRQLAATGQSMGKKWMGIRIVRTSGEKAALSRLVTVRFLPLLVGAVPYLGPLIGLVNVLMIFGEGQRCLHDRLADTLVVKC